MYINLTTLHCNTKFHSNNLTVNRLVSYLRLWIIFTRITMMNWPWGLPMTTTNLLLFFFKSRIAFGTTAILFSCAAVDSSKLSGEIEHFHPQKAWVCHKNNWHFPFTKSKQSPELGMMKQMHSTIIEGKPPSFLWFWIDFSCSRKPQASNLPWSSFCQPHYHCRF